MRESSMMMLRASVVKYWQCYIITAAGLELVEKQLKPSSQFYSELHCTFVKYINLLRHELPQDLDVSLLMKSSMIKQEGDGMLSGESIWRKFKETQRHVVNLYLPIWSRLISYDIILFFLHSYYYYL
jgi:hypothetical protein